MTDKAYIVANKEQEFEVLKHFEQNGLTWRSGENPTEWVLSEKGLFNFNASFPYALAERENKKITWLAVEELTYQTIVYDGRKEEKMYKVTQEFMNELIEWRDEEDVNVTSGESYNYINHNDLADLPSVAVAWWVDDKYPIERNNRLIAIIQWLNGEDVFEVEEPHKFIVRSDVTDEDGEYWYVNMHRDMSSVWYQFGNATRFNTREEAQEWANSHQVVVEIDADGNEV